MTRGRAMTVGLGVLAALIVPEACHPYTTLAGDDDAGGEAGTSSSSGAPGEAGSTVPPFRPSFANDAGPNDLLGEIGEICPTLLPTGGPIHGDYAIESLCVSKTKFVEPFAKFCDGITITGTPANALVRVQGGLHDNQDGTVNRTGYQWLAAELRAPCKSFGNGSCSGLGATVGSLLRANRPNLQITCFDDPNPTVCICQMEDQGPLQDDAPLVVDADAGTLGSDFLYGFEGDKLDYTGREKTGPTDFTIEPAFLWKLKPIP